MGNADPFSIPDPRNCIHFFKKRVNSANIPRHLSAHPESRFHSFHRPTSGHRGPNGNLHRAGMLCVIQNFASAYKLWTPVNVKYVYTVKIFGVGLVENERCTFFELLLEKRKIYVNRPFINQIMKNKSFCPFVCFVEFRRRQTDNWNILE